MNIKVALTCLLLSACASQQAFNSPGEAANVNNVVELAALEARALTEPNNLVLRAHIARQKEYLTQNLLDASVNALRQNDFNQANMLLDEAAKINPASPGVVDGKRELESARRHQEGFKKAQESFIKGDIELAERGLKPILIENASHTQAKALMRKIARGKATALTPPKMKANISKPITLEFKQTSLKTIFEMIARTTNINFIFDKGVKGDTKTTVFLRNTKIEEAMQVILVTNQLAQKILSENTILIYPNTDAKNKEYQELLVRNFYLESADVKEMVNVIKTIVKTQDIVFDEKRNMITVRDTAQAIGLVEKLIAARDMAEPEVMLELEVLEVGRTRMQELGVRFPERLSFSALSAAGTPGALTIAEWRGLNSNTIGASITDPSLILNLRRLDTDTNLLANPRIRVKNRESAKVHIGERVPVITTTSTANVGVTESVAYLDVGLKLDIQPDVFLNDEVSMKVGLEVSNILETIVLASGTQTYRLGTRNTSTTLRLRDGETQVLAGLIQDDERKTTNKLPFFGNLPILGKLFSNSDSRRTKTEIVLLITPRIIRNIHQPEVDISEFTSGTASSIGASPLQVTNRPKKANKALPRPAITKPVLPNSAVLPNTANQAVEKIPKEAASITPVVIEPHLGPQNVRVAPPTPVASPSEINAKP